ncbi:hypothetical protein CPB97_006185, partial [Podila verticillata]
LPCVWRDLRGTSDQENHVKELSQAEANTPFDFERGPLIRAQLIQVQDDEYIFLLTMHHIISDGWSMGVLMRELNELYSAFSAGRSDPLPSLSVQYPDYASWQKQWLTDQRLEEHVDYWRKTLVSAPLSIELPTDRPRPPQQSFVGATVPIGLDVATTQALKQLAQKHGATLFMTILTAWSAVLSRLSGQDDIVIGTPTANRTHRDIEQLIGFFVNALALRIDLSGEPSLEQTLDR